MGNLVNFCDYLTIEVCIELIIIENMKIRLTFHIKLVSFENIDICPIYGPNSIIFGAYVQIWAYSILLITQRIFIQF